MSMCKFTNVKTIRKIYCVDFIHAKVFYAMKKSFNYIEELEYIRKNKVGLQRGCDAVRVIEVNKALWDFIMVPKPEKKVRKHSEIPFGSVVIEEIRFSVAKTSTYELCDRLTELDPSLVVVENGADTHDLVTLLWHICPCCV